MRFFSDTQNGSRQRLLLWGIWMLGSCLAVWCLMQCTDKPAVAEEVPAVFASEPQLVQLIVQLKHTPTDTTALRKSFSQLTENQLNTVLGHLSVLDTVLPSLVPVLQGVAQRRGDTHPAATLSLMALYGDQIQELYGTYTAIGQKWLKRQPDSATRYIIESPMHWAGPAVQMGDHLREILAARQLETSLTDGLQWLDQLKNRRQQVKMAEAFFSQVYLDSIQLKTFAGWVGRQASDASYRFVCERLVKAYASFDRQATLHWCQGLPIGASRYLACTTFFYHCGYNYPLFVIRCFNTDPQCKQLFRSPESGKLTGAMLREDVIFRFVQGLLDNHETDVYPAEYIEQVTDSYFRSLVQAEYTRQWRRLDPANAF